MMNIEAPVVSVVMTVFNGERFLAEAVQSILAQDFADFEFIIIDDGSTDESATMLDRYQRLDSRVKVFHENHAGLVTSLNRGCGLARGKYIARMDADDVAHKDRLTQQVAFMEANPEIAILGAAVEWISASGKSLYISRNPAKHADIRADLVLHRRCAFWHPTILMRKEVFALTGGYRSRLIGAEDYDLWLRAAEKFQLANLETVVLRYRIHSSQASIQQRIQQTHSTLAAQLAAKRRQEGLKDPLDDGSEITSERLAAWGISVTEQRNEVYEDYRKWIKRLGNAEDYDAALKAALEVADTGGKEVERWQVADVHLLIAKLLWRKGEILSSVLSVAHAVLLRPIVIGRPLKLIGLWLIRDAGTDSSSGRPSPQNLEALPPNRL